MALPQVAQGSVSVGGKKVPKAAVLGGAAATAGYVGWRWFQAGRTVQPATGAIDPTGGVGTPPVDVPTDNTDFDISGNIVPTQPTNNADWVQLAISRAVAVGFDGAALAIALGKFLARQPLTATEAELVRQAIAQAGPPPQNTPPYVVIDKPSGSGGVVPGNTKPLAPSSVRASVSGSRISASWSAVAGATSYDVRLIRGYPVGEGGPYRNNGLATATSFIQQPTHDVTYTVEVRAKNKSGAGPHKRSNPVKVYGHRK